MSTSPGTLTYRVVEDWERLPAEFRHGDVAGVAVDARDRVYLITRQDSRVIVYDRDGAFLTSWGEDRFSPRTHGITIGPDGTVYCVDEGHHVVQQFTPEGTLLMTIGNYDRAADTGYDGRAMESITRGGPPFNRPTNLAVAPSGDLYITDGYGNARVHRFAHDGRLLHSWGEPGTGPGQFHLPHGLAVAPDGRVLVADRENDRVQIFSPTGEFMAEWTDVQRPTNIALDGAGRVYVSELWRKVGERTPRHGTIADDRPGRVSVYDAEGHVLARWGGSDRCAAGNFVAPHDICVDSRGAIYVGEVTWTFGVRPGLVPEDCHTLQKFEVGK